MIFLHSKTLDFKKNTSDLENHLCRKEMWGWCDYSSKKGCCFIFRADHRIIPTFILKTGTHPYTSLNTFNKKFISCPHFSFLFWSFVEYRPSFYKPFLVNVTNKMLNKIMDTQYKMLHLYVALKVFFFMMKVSFSLSIFSHCMLVCSIKFFLWWTSTMYVEAIKRRPWAVA